MIVNVAWVIGIVLTIVGIWGYFQAPVFSIFAVNGSHNMVHLVSGIAGLLAALGGDFSARRYLQLLGVVYGLVFVLGLVSGSMILGSILTNTADNLLHLGIAVIAVFIGFGKKRAVAGSPTPASQFTK